LRDAGQRTDGFHRTNTGMIESNLPAWIVVQHAKQLQNVGVIGRELICRPIAANDDVLCHRVSPPPPRKPRLWSAMCKRSRILKTGRHAPKNTPWICGGRGSRHAMHFSAAPENVERIRDDPRDLGHAGHLKHAVLVFGPVIGNGHFTSTPAVR
jgi:hypothetical protein